MKKFFIYVLSAFMALSAAFADEIKTVYVDLPARVRVLQDSTFTFKVRGVDSKKVNFDIKNDTLYFRTNKSDLENTFILITTPNPKKLNFTTSRNYEIRNY